MKNKIIEIRPDELIKVVECELNKKLQLVIDQNYCAYVGCQGSVYRVENESLKDFCKDHKDFVGKVVYITIYKKVELRKIPWGIGDIAVNENVVGLNGQFDFLISNFTLFKECFGQYVLLKDFKKMFLQKITSKLSPVVQDYAKKYRLDIDKMDSCKTELEKVLKEKFTSHEIDTEEMGIEINEFKIKSFIVN
jgi:hypothetical protein